MKKLLVILLFLFPVHGAWAEKLHLQCTLSKVSSSAQEKPIIGQKIYYEIDLKNKTVKKYNTSPLQYIDDKNIHFQMAHYHEKEGYGVMAYISINRIDGTFMLEGSKPITNAEIKKYLKIVTSRPPIETVGHGECLKWSGKKKF